MKSRIMALLLLAAFATPSAAGAATLQEIQALLDSIRAQAEALKAQSSTPAAVTPQNPSVSVEAKLLTRQLRQGMSGEDVRSLQALLATDPSIYPEAIISGYYGPLTARAVARFQAAANLEQVGNVGPKTFAKINEILAYGAGSSGSIPPGLLFLPAIKEQLTGTIAGADLTPPIIFNISGTTTATSTSVFWTTNEPTSAIVYYATSTPVNITTALKLIDASTTTSHAANLTNLLSSTDYYLMIVATDAAGNWSSSLQIHFKTRSE